MDNYWFFGPPGSGKSRAARRLCAGNFYSKDPSTEWFTGYTGQPNVIIDDWEPWNKSSSGWLKRLADHYSFTARVHQGQVTIRPIRIIVTSNYSIEECFPMQAQQVQAVQRRFRECLFSTEFGPPETIELLLALVPEELPPAQQVQGDQEAASQQSDDDNQIHS